MINLLKRIVILLFGPRKYKVKYLVCIGAMSLHEEIYICKAYSKFGAYKQFRMNTKRCSHYTDETRLNSFWCIWKDISRI